MKDPNVYPPGLDAKKVQEIIAHYDSLTEEEWVAHDEYAHENPYTVDVLVPRELLSAVQDLIARHEADHPEETAAAQAWLDRKSDGPGNFPPGWNSERVQRLIAEAKEEEANWTEEDEAELQQRLKGKASFLVPDKLVPAIRALIAEHAASLETRSDA